MNFESSWNKLLSHSAVEYCIAVLPLMHAWSESKTLTPLQLYKCKSIAITPGIELVRISRQIKLQGYPDEKLKLIDFNDELAASLILLAYCPTDPHEIEQRLGLMLHPVSLYNDMLQMDQKWDKADWQRLHKLEKGLDPRQVVEINQELLEQMSISIAQTLDGIYESYPQMYKTAQQLIKGKASKKDLKMQGLQHMGSLAGDHLAGFDRFISQVQSVQQEPTELSLSQGAIRSAWQSLILLAQVKNFDDLQTVYPLLASQKEFKAHYKSPELRKWKNQIMQTSEDQKHSDAI